MLEGGASGPAPLATTADGRSSPRRSAPPGGAENPFTGQDVDPFSEPSEPAQARAPRPLSSSSSSSNLPDTSIGPNDWSNAASSSRYNDNNNDPDWMRVGGGQSRQQPESQSATPEFGTAGYRKPDIQFDGEDVRTRATNEGGSVNNLNQSLLDPRGGRRRQHNHEQQQGGRRRCCGGEGGCCGGSKGTTQILLLVTLLSASLFVISLMHAFRGDTNMARGAQLSFSTSFRANASVPFAAAAATAASGAPCPTTCLTPAALQKSKTCAYQFQYTDPGTKKRVCGAPTCWTSGNGIPSPWKYPLSFSCAGASSGAAFFCPWDHHLTTWRAMSSGGGSAASLAYIYALRSCRTCVGCTVGLISLLCLGHALLSFICMVQDSDAVRQAATFCAGATIKCEDGGEGRQRPTCLMLPFTVVCLLDAALGLGWCAVGYAVCKSRAKE